MKENKMMVTHDYFAAVRHSADGYDWIDSQTLAVLPELAKRKADAADREIPQWAQANRQVRIARVRLEEIK
jgi:hypothetical protein